MHHLPSFKVVRARLNIVTVKGKTKINNSYDDFVEIIKMLISGVAVDEKWYLSTNDDVARAVAAGVCKSGRQHFIEVGYFEGRRPQEFAVDEQWYLRTYPDVAEAIKQGDVDSACEHFNLHGYDEGRSPANL